MSQLNFSSSTINIFPALNLFIFFLLGSYLYIDVPERFLEVMLDILTD